MSPVIAPDQGIAPVIGKRPKLTKAERVKIFDREKGICHLCGLRIKAEREKWQADHVKARWRNGGDKLGNYKPAHIRCHVAKSAAENTERAKADRNRAAHLGIKDAPARPFPKGRSLASPKPKRDQLPIPPRRNILTGKVIA